MSQAVLRNFMENVVLDVIDEITKSMEVCNCNKCRLDIAAIALNNLPTKYIVTDKGELYSKVNLFKLQTNVDVRSAIIKAALIVSKNPMH